MDILFKNAHLIDAFSEVKKADLLVRNGKIQLIAHDLSEFISDLSDIRIIEAEGKVLMPGFVDTHAHFREPGYCYKEDLETGSRQAAHGGYTFVNLMANTKPVCQDNEAFLYCKKKQKDYSLIALNQTLALTKNLEGKELIDFENLLPEIKILSDDGKGVYNNQLMYEACKLAAKYGKTIMVHAEDKDISPYDYRVAEDLMTIRDVYLAGQTSCHIHMSHVSTRHSIEAVAYAKNQSWNVSCEVTPHHLLLTADKCQYRVNPPLRTEDDRRCLIEMIKNSVVDCIATDHAPHSESDKLNNAPGMIGNEFAFAICYKVLVLEEGLSLNKLSYLMSYRPAEILGLHNTSLLEVGRQADLVLIDLNDEIQIDENFILSKSKNTPLMNWKLPSKIILTLCEGRIVYADSDLI